MPTEVRGAIALRKALRKFEPDLAKGLTKEMALALRPVVKAARGYLPSNEEQISGWVKNVEQDGRWSGTRGYDAATAKRGVGFKTTPSKPNRNGFRSIVTIFNKNAAGAIYETAGRKSGVQSGHFNPKMGGALKGKNKMQGRVIFRAYEENQGKAKAAVLKAIEGAANQLNLRGK